MRIFTLGLCLLFSLNAFAQTIIADFENFGLNVGEFINQAPNGESFKVGALSLPNSFNPNYSSWSGWAISATNDTTTPGFTNQYSSIVGSGFDGSTTYGVAFEFGQNVFEIENNGEPTSGIVNGMYISNSTYAFLSMLEGDSFAKIFGGETGDDPDFLSIVFRGVVGGELSTDSLEFFLADYRFDDNNEDYILDD